MALIQATSPTGTAQLTDVFDSAYINRVVREVAQEPMIGQSIVDPIDLTGGDVHSYSFVSPLFNEMTGAAVVPENDAAPEDALESDSLVIDGNRIALRTFVLDATERAIVPVANLAIERLTRAVRRYFHEEILALLPSFTNVQGSNSVENTLANWDLVTHNFRVQNHSQGRLWAIFAPDALRDLRADLVSNAAALFGAAFGDRAANALHNQQPGAAVPWDGFDLYMSGNAPAGDTTGWTSAVGVQGAIGMPIWQDLKAEMQRDVSRFGTWIVVSMVAATGIMNQHDARAFITRT